MTNFKKFSLVITALLSHWLRYKKPEGRKNAKDFKSEAKKLAKDFEYSSKSSDQYTIVFSGTPGQGKSSTINQLLGTEVLPTGAVGATTGVPTIIRHSENSRADILFSDKSKDTLSIDNPTPQQLEPYIDTDAVKEIHVYVPFNFLPQELRSKIRLVDVPGAFSIENAHHTEIAIDMMASAHLIYLFMDYGRPTLADLDIFKAFVKQQQHAEDILGKTYFVFNKIDKFYDDDKTSFIQGNIGTEHAEGLVAECRQLLGAKNGKDITNRTLYVSTLLAEFTNTLLGLNITNSKELDTYCNDFANDEALIAQLEEHRHYLRAIQRNGTENSVEHLKKLSRFDAFINSMVEYLERIDFNAAVFLDFLSRCKKLHNDIGDQLTSERAELIQETIAENNDQIAQLNTTLNAADPKVKDLKQQIVNATSSIKLELSKQIQKATNGIHGIENSMVLPLYKITKISTDKGENRSYRTSIIKGVKDSYTAIAPKVTEVNQALSTATEAIISKVFKSVGELKQDIILTEQVLPHNDSANINVPLLKFIGDNNFIKIPEDSQLYIETMYREYPLFWNNDYKLVPNVSILSTHLENLRVKVNLYQQDFEAKLGTIEQHLLNLLNNGHRAYKQQQLDKIGVLEKNNKTLQSGLKDASIDVSRFSDELQANANRLQEHATYTNDLNTISNAL